jgi:hypothetical protein
MILNGAANIISGNEAIQVCCRLCGEQPKFVYSMLDSRKGHNIRIFKCECGEQTWTDHLN